MIDWLERTTADHPGLARGVAPEGLLADEERLHLDGLSVPKRRRDWLLGRWTAKQLVRAWLDKRHGLQLSLDKVVVRRGASGNPEVHLQANGHGPLPASVPPLSLSISHSGDRAISALCDRPRVRVGVDVETVEPRPARFAKDYLAEEEIACLDEVTNGDMDALTTVIWSAKEAVLKALHLGLAVDTRRVRCIPRSTTGAGQGWQPFLLSCDPGVLEKAIPANGERPRTIDLPHLTAGWWIRSGRSVRTLAVVTFPSEVRDRVA